MNLPSACLSVLIIRSVRHQKPRTWRRSLPLRVHYLGFCLSFNDQFLFPELRCNGVLTCQSKDCKCFLLKRFKPRRSEGAKFFTPQSSLHGLSMQSICQQRRFNH